jgi:hypothetical protein
MVALSYDDNAFNFFVITLLLLYLFPAGWYIARRVWSFKAQPDTAHAARTQAERRKLEQLAREQQAGPDGKPVLWTRPFTIFTGVTVALALLCVVLIMRSGAGVELAQYDPYAVSAALHSTNHRRCCRHCGRRPSGGAATRDASTRRTSLCGRRHDRMHDWQRRQWRRATTASQPVCCGEALQARTTHARRLVAHRRPFIHHPLLSHSPPIASRRCSAWPWAPRPPRSRAPIASCRCITTPTSPRVTRRCSRRSPRRTR